MVNPSQLRFGKELERLQISDILSLIQNNIDESQNLEYKEPSNNLGKDCEHLAKSMSGFLNTDGGILIYGVSERKEGDHRYPTNIEWCNTTKERLENLLKSKIQPWEERIRIHRIKSRNNEKVGIFVIEIPKSNNPPHMYNYSYYQRLNFQTQPMTHQSVLRVIQTSWIRRRELHLNVLEPLYSEIKMNCERIENYKRGEDTQYQSIILNYRYLYDQVDSSIQKKIDEFYRRMDKLNPIIDWQAHKIAMKIINEELCRLDIWRDWVEKHMENDNLFASVTLRDASGSISIVRETMNGALLQRKEIESYLQSQHSHAEVVKFEPVVHLASDNKIHESNFMEFWESCKSRAGRNKAYSSMWLEIPELVALGKEIIELMLAK